MTSPSTIAITGASRGLGAALALEYAAPGRLLALAARNEDELTQVKQECEKRGAKAITQRLDIRQHVQLEAWIAAVEKIAPIDLIIANAGVFSGRGPDNMLEPLEEQIRQINTNLSGAMATAHIAAEFMLKRQSGHIAIVSSLAAWQPMADAPAYSASKAGLLAYGEALRETLLEGNIKISIILPGHIKTAQTKFHVGTTPGIISPQKAAKIIFLRLERGDATIAFPQTTHWLVRLGRLLPFNLRVKINRLHRFHVKNPSDHGNSKS